MTTALTADVQEANASFDDLVATLQTNFEAKLAKYKHLFQVNPKKSLFSVYLDSLNDKGGRQSHACNTCGHFLKTYGNLVFIDENNTLISAIWDETGVDAYYRDTVIDLRDAVTKGTRVQRQFFAESAVFGNPEVGGWKHFAITSLIPVRSGINVQTPYEKMAQSMENMRTLSTALEQARYTPEVLAEIYSDIKSFEGETGQRFAMQAEWLLRAANGIPYDSKANSNKRRNYLWLLVANAPTGYCTPRSSPLGAFIDESTTENGKMRSSALRRQALRSFSERVRSDNYQRPTAAPKEGAIDRAEKLIEQLGLASALQRRVASVDEVPCIWQPAAVVPKQDTPQEGVFGALRKGAKKEAVVAKVDHGEKMSFAAFRRRVLPKATKIEAWVQYRHLPFYVFSTAVDEDSKDIFKWPGKIASHTFTGGVLPSHMGLRAESWHEVTGIALLPWMHDDEEGNPQFKRGAVLLLKDIQEEGLESLALFPEILDNALHEVRSVIEAHSNNTKMQDIEDNRAQGLYYKKAVIRVHDGLSVTDYIIDRWE